MIDRVEHGRQRYLKEQPAFEHLVKQVEGRLDALLRLSGIPALVTGRAKDVGSLVKKLIRTGKRYPAIRDKAGVRARLLYPDDRERALEAVRAHFTIVDIDEKRASRDHKTFDYAGAHLIVRLSNRGLLCEIQIHTPGEGLWASVAHDLIYKDQHDVPTDLRRAMHRLCAMTELFDDEVSRVRSRLSGPSHEAHAMLFELERVYLGLSSVEFDKQLSLASLPHLKGIVRDEITADRVQTFAAKHDAKLREIYSTRKPESEPLLFQPEALLIFLALEDDEFHCAEAWPNDHLPFLQREHFEDIWGKSA
jgi:ppGpp synthetase/RelA/SpoT-type nucleotidyltranferase